MTEIIDELKTNLESSEETQTTQDIQQIEVETEEQNTRAYYKQQADNLGLNYPQNISTEKLKQIVGNKMKQIRSEKPKENNVAANQFKDMRALVRIQINVLNPAKQNWTGEIFTVGNDVIPHMTRFIPYNAVNGIWHVERMFVEMLKSRKYQRMVEHSGSRNDPSKYGVDYHRNQLVPEYSIIELP